MNSATPSYSSGSWPASTQSDAPPMMVFVGAASTSSQCGRDRMSKSNSASALTPAYPAELSV